MVQKLCRYNNGATPLVYTISIHATKRRLSDASLALEPLPLFIQSLSKPTVKFFLKVLPLRPKNHKNVKINSLRNNDNISDCKYLEFL